MDRWLLQLLVPSVLSIAGHVHVCAADGITREAAREHIDRLASRNQAPMLKQGRSRSIPVYPGNFDHLDGERVQAVYSEINDRFAEYLPFLVEFLDDERYSHTRQRIADGGCENLNVGETLCDLIRENIVIYRECFETHLRATFLADPAWIRAWHEKNQGKTIAELQIEWCERGVAQARKSEWVKKEELEDGIECVSQLVATIRKAGRPLKRRGDLQLYYDSSK